MLGRAGVRVSLVVRTGRRVAWERWATRQRAGLLEAAEDPFETSQGRLVVLQLEKRLEFPPDQGPIEPVRLPQNDAFDIQPVLLAAGENLQDQKVLRAACRQSH